MNLSDGAQPQYDEQKKLQQAFAKRMRAMQEEESKRKVVRAHLTPEAYERLSNIRVANQSLYEQLVDLIISLAQTKRLVGKMTDAQLKSILEKVASRPEPTIHFRHK